MSSQEFHIEWYKSKYAYILIGLALIGSFANIFYSIGSYSWPAGDESWHYSYSKRYYETGETERETIHNYNSTTPVVLLNVFAVKAYERCTGNLVFNKKVARSIQVGWYILLILGVGIVSYYIAGANVAWWAIFLLALDPNLSAHSALIGSDIPFVAMSLWVLFAIFRYLDKPSIIRASVLGLTYGLAFCTKYSATFYAIPIGLSFFVAFFRILKNRKSTIKEGNVFRKNIAKSFSLLFHMLVVIIVVTAIVNCAYSFAGTGQPLTIKAWYTDIFRYLRNHYGTIPSPWPIPFLSGFDHQLSVERIRAWNVVFLGKHFPNGIWYYFLVIWAVKTTLGVVFLTLIIICLSPKILINLREYKTTWMIIVVTWLSLFIYFSFIFRTQVGLRYAFPCLPLAYILMGGFISRRWTAKWQSRIAVVLLFVAMYEEIPYFGNGISFTNSIISNKTNAYTWIADSNIDWFQNYPSAYAEAKATIGEYHSNPPHILPGNNVFTLNKLTGVMHNFKQYEWVRKNWKPSMHFQHTLLLYEVDKEKFDEYLNTGRTFSEPPEAGKICDAQRNYKEIDKFVSSNIIGWVSKPSRLFTGCLKVTEDAVFEVKVKKGYATIGSYPKEYHCEGLEAGPGNSLWFKFKPGIHPICILVDNAADTELIQLSGKAQFALRTR